MTDQYELLFKTLAELKRNPTINAQKIAEAELELKKRGYNIPYNKNLSPNSDEPFEDEGAPDDDFID